MVLANGTITKRKNKRNLHWPNDKEMFIRKIQKAAKAEGVRVKNNDITEQSICSHSGQSKEVL